MSLNNTVFVAAAVAAGFALFPVGAQSAPTVLMAQSAAVQAASDRQTLNKIRRGDRGNRGNGARRGNRGDDAKRGQRTDSDRARRNRGNGGNRRGQQGQGERGQWANQGSHDFRSGQLFGGPLWRNRPDSNGRGRDKRRNDQRVNRDQRINDDQAHLDDQREHHHNEPQYRDDRGGVWHRHEVPGAGLFAKPGYGAVVATLPEDPHRIEFESRTFFYAGDTWYRQRGQDYVVTMPPAGIAVPYLPTDYVEVQVGSQMYYKADQVYYASSRDGFVVIRRPGDVRESGRGARQGNQRNESRANRRRQ